MNNNEKISIVVPIYNVEEYLPRCLDSIIGQTYTNIEIMLVDDGSPDNAGAICDEYVAKDSRIRVFHIPNGGVGKARQLGVECSTGEYIVFVDPDDWLPLDSVEVLYANMTDDVDLVVGAPMFVTKNRSTPYTIQERLSEDLIKELLMQTVVPQPWAKLYRKTLFNDNSFPNFKKSQDWLMNIDISTRVRKARIVDKIVYLYFDNRGTSTVNSYNTSVENEINFIEECQRILKNADKYSSHLNSFASFTLHCLTRAMCIGLRVNSNDFRIKRIMSDISSASLSKSDKIRIFIVRYSIIQRVAHIYYNLRRGFKFIMNRL